MVTPVEPLTFTSIFLSISSNFKVVHWWLFCSFLTIQWTNDYLIMVKTTTTTTNWLGRDVLDCMCGDHISSLMITFMELCLTLFASHLGSVSSGLQWKQAGWTSEKARLQWHGPVLSFPTSLLALSSFRREKKTDYRLQNVKWGIVFKWNTFDESDKSSICLS